MFWRSSRESHRSARDTAAAPSRLLDLASLLGKPLAEPVARFLRGRELVLEVLIDVVLRDRVDRSRRERRIGRRYLTSTSRLLRIGETSDLSGKVDRARLPDVSAADSR